MQKTNQIKTVPLADIPSSPLCPVAAFLELIATYPVNHNCPMFSFMRGGCLVVVTQRQVRQHLATVMARMGLNPQHHTFHTFRRSGATLAFNLRVPLQDIQSHGTWLSDAVWTYIQPSLTHTAIPQAFKSLLHK